MRPLPAGRGRHGRLTAAGVEQQRPATTSANPTELDAALAIAFAPETPPGRRAL